MIWATFPGIYDPKPSARKITCFGGGQGRKLVFGTKKVKKTAKIVSSRGCIFPFLRENVGKDT